MDAPDQRAHRPNGIVATSAGVNRRSEVETLVKRYTKAGYSIILVGGDKRPLGKWGHASETQQNVRELRAQLAAAAKGVGLAVVGGKVSGGLIIIDFDPDKEGRAQGGFDLEREFVAPWRESIRRIINPDTLPCQQTPSGGVQFYLRTNDPEGNTKLAGVPAWRKRDGAVLTGEAGTPHYAIETRGEGGYAVIPTPDSGRTWLQGDLDATPFVSRDVAVELIKAARRLDRVPQPTPAKQTASNAVSSPREGESVINTYNKTHSPKDVLERYGYIHQAGRWLAPDSSSKTPGVSIKDGRAYSHHGSDPLSDGHAHDAFGIYTVLEHNGDVKMAVKQAAADLGFEKGNSTRGTAAQPVKSSPTEDAPDLLIYHRTDYGNAERLHALYGGEFRYCAALGFLVWDRRRWQIDAENARMKGLAVKAARELQAQTLHLDESDTRMSWGKYALSCERSAAISNAIDLVKSVPGVTIDVDALDADSMLLNIQNGTIDLRDGTIRAHNPNDLITKLAPVSYDPQATCPQWLEFQVRISAADENLQAFKQRAYGYSLTGKTSEDVLFIPYGTGANGKSTELTVIGELMGDYANTAQFETFAVRKSEGVRNDVADLVGARFVSASEGENRQRLAEGLVKQMTGGDVLKARFLHKEYFRFKPNFKLWLATNHKPVIRGTDEGIWRRIRLIPYTVTIPPEQRDKRLREKLDAERSGILNWLLEGCAAWHERGLGESQAVTEATTSYRRESDVLAEFVAARCTTGPEYSELSRDLYSAYEAWCADNTEEAYSPTTFGRMLGERGYDSKQDRRSGKNEKYRTGICLSEHAEGEV